MTNVFHFSGNRKRFPGRILFLLLLLSSSPFISAQSLLKLQGQVVDSRTKQSVLGATVTVKDGTGKKSTTFTDGKGEFAFQVASYPVNLVVEFVGYKDENIDVYEELKAPLVVEVTETRNLLNTVVVIGYGTQKRSELTGSVASIPVSQITSIQPSSFVAGLQGLASGVQVTQTSGAPGGSASIRIRGGNSITGGNEPLYVIDGFPIYNDNSSSNAGALNGGLTSAGTKINPLSFLSPNDIESIDILKDAAATAIYGSRGANGVIIITTKKGKIGANKVSYDVSFGTQSVSHKIDLLSAAQWAVFKNDARASIGSAALFTDDEIAAYETSGGTDWQSAILRKAPIQNHQLTIVGGNEQTKYSISAGYLGQDGIVINSDFKRYSGRLYLEAKVSDKFSVGASFIEAYSESKVIPDGVFSATLQMPAVVSIYNSATTTGYTYKSPYELAIANPVATLNLETNLSNTNRLLVSGFGSYEFIKGLSAKLLIGADLINNKQNSYIPQALYEGSTYAGLAAVGTKSSQNLLNENTITYSKSFKNEHNFEFLAGFTQQQSVTEGVVARSDNYANDLTTYNDLSAGATALKPSSSYSKWTLKSYLGRVTYNYKQKYFATASFRTDGSSRLGVNNRWGYFPSASFAWQTNKESFFREFANTAHISNLKVRISAGRTGNQEILPYQSEALLTSYSYPTTGTSTLSGYAVSQLANPNLKWETTAQYDGGFDLGLAKDRINLIVDVYYKKTSDLLLSVPIATTTGYSSVLENIGSVRNKGIEITLNTQNVKTKAFSWNTDITYSINRNKVLSLNSGTSVVTLTSELQTGSAIVVGQPLGAFWGYKTDGLYKSTDEIPSSPLLGTSITKVGDVKYVDINEDDAITQAEDMTVIGNAQPKFIGGITNNFTFKHFDLSVFAQFTYGNKIYSYIIQQLMVPSGYRNAIAGFADHYTSTNTTAKYQRANANSTTNAVSDLYVFDGSFLKIKSVNLGYSLPKGILSKLKVEKVRLYASATNLFTFTKYIGFDPEVNYFDSNSARQGVDFGAYPSSKTYTAGLSIVF
jgi:TonB-dependent starch-binding outer membrane protein SusC